MKRSISLICLLCFSVILGVIFTSCDEVQNPEHTHTYKTVWSHDDTYHWHACEDETCAETSQKTEHSIESGVCCVCGYEKTAVHTCVFESEISRDATYHWYACTNASCSLFDAKERHTGEEAIRENEVEATCDSMGRYDSVVYCSVCRLEISRESISIPAVAHLFVSGKCESCGCMQATDGLSYTLSDDGFSYSVTGIGEAKDTRIVIPSTYEGRPVVSIANNAFENCQNIVSIVIPENVTTIQYGAFQNCVNLTSVVIPSSVITINTYAFRNCYRLVEVVNKSNLELTRGFTTHGCIAEYAKQIIDGESDSRLEFDDEGFIIYHDGQDSWLISYVGSKISIKTPENVTKINEYAFYECTGLESIEVDEGVTTIGYGAFYGCDKLKTILLPNSTEYIEACAFAYCDSLENIELPDNISYIGHSAFTQCIGLKTVTIPLNVTRIDEGTFSGCINLSHLKILDNLEYVSGSALTYTGLELIEVVEANNSFVSVDGNLYTKDGKTLVRYASRNESTTFTIPDDVIVIGDYAFDNCKCLVDVKIGENVRHIGRGAFANCTALLEVYIPSGVEKIEGSAFQSCFSLKSVFFDKDCEVQIFESGLFHSCSSLKEIEIPNNVTKIEDLVFAYCFSLQEIFIPSNVFTLEEQVFLSCFSLSVYCEAASRPDGWHDEWNACGHPYYTKCSVIWDYRNNNVATDGCIYVIESGVKYALKDGHATVVKHQPDDIEGRIVISANINYEGNTFVVTTIETDAFRGCELLKEIVIPGTVTTVGQEVFDGCVNLTIFCEAENKPDGWKNNWNPENCPVVWDYSKA